MIRVDGLDQHDAGRLAAAGAPGGLRQKLERSLRGAEVGQAQAEVGIDDAHQRHIGDVVAFGDHLRAHQDVVVVLAEAGQDGFVVALAADGVAIQPRDAGLGKERAQLLFHTLAADADELDIFAIALGAAFGNWRRVVAVVAQHAAVAPVIGQRDGAVDALHALAAGAARDETRKAAPVEQQHGLLAVLQTLCHGVDQRARKGRLLAGFQELLAHVDYGNWPAWGGARCVRAAPAACTCRARRCSGFPDWALRSPARPPRLALRARTTATSRP